MTDSLTHDLPVGYELVPVGRTYTHLAAGDLIFVRRPRYRQLHGTRLHRTASWLLGVIIWFGQHVRPSLRPWANFTHVACATGSSMLIEAHSGGVKRAYLTEYHDRDYMVVRTGLSYHDSRQALAFLHASLGEGYGYLIFIGIAIRMLTPGRGGLFLGLTRTNICSGLGAQMLERGWYIFDVLPASVCPAELARDLGVARYAA